MKARVFALLFVASASALAQVQPPNASGGPDRNRPGPWDNDVLVYRVATGGEMEKLATFERAGVPTVARLKDGRLIAAFQNFPEDDKRNFDRVAVRFSSGEGRTWSKPEPIVVEGMDAGLARPFDPTLVPLPDGRVRLYFTSNRSPDFRRSTPQIYSAISTNGIHYTFEPGARFGLEGRIVIDCAVALHEGMFHLIVPDNGAAGDFMPRPQRGQQPMGGSGYHAISKDGLSFERVADVKLASFRDRWLGNMQSDGGRLVFFGTGPGPWPVSSQDGVAWGSSTVATHVPGADPGAVKLRDGSWLLLVTGEPRPGTPSALQRGNRRGPFPNDEPDPRRNPRPPNEGEPLTPPPAAPDMQPGGFDSPPPPSGGLRSHQVLSASSADGLIWTRDEGVRVTSASVPCAINDGDRRVLLYFVKPPTQPGQPETVACAVSTDGLRFDPAPEFRIEGLSAIKAVDPSILKDGDGKFRLYYLASNHRGDPASGENPHKITFALSDDGIHFREAGAAFSSDNLVDPDVFRFKDRWFMYVFAGYGTVIATSADGKDFKFLREMTPRDWGTTAAVQLPDGRLRLYAFEQRVPIGNAVRSFLSTNGLDWTAEPGVRLQAGPDGQITDPFVIPWQGGWKMYFKTSPARTPSGPSPQGPNRRAQRTAGAEVEPGAAKPHLIRVNAGEVTGRIRSLLGVNRGPLAWPRGAGGKTASLVESYRRFGIDFIRTHDFYGPTDWHVIFPRWDADPADAASYDFRSSDERIRAIVENGFGCFYRLGTSWKGRRLEPINDPPGTKRDAAGRVTHVADRDDFKRWAAICAQTVRHYTEGWNNGFKFPIEYWEIWNEPDLAAQFWTGTPEQYYALYEEAARAVKAVNPKLKIGGPACTGGLREAYVERFIRYCAERQVPLDFFSWHSYGGRDEFNPYQFKRDAERIRRVLDAAGFKQTENINTEWNAGIQQRLFSDTPRGAAFYTSTLACLLDAGVDRAFQYCGDQHPGLGLHELRTGEPKICTFAFAAWKQLLETPERLAATGSDERGYNVVAGRSADSRRVQILISDYQSNDCAFRLRAEKLPWAADAKVSVKRWLLDADHRFTVVEESSTSGNDITLERPFRSESVCLVELQAVERETAPPAVATPREDAAVSPEENQRRSAETPLRPPLGARARGELPQFESVFIRIPSSAAGKEGVAASVLLPRQPRFTNGAPVVINVIGGVQAGNARGRPEYVGRGFVEIHFAFPGGGVGEERSGGTYDFRGPNCIRALADVIRFGTGRIVAQDGRGIAEIAHGVSVLTNNVGLVGSSHGGNASGMAMAKFGDEFPNLAWYASMESPYGEGAANVELGGHESGVNPAYDPKTGALDLSKLAWSSELSPGLFRKPMLVSTREMKGAFFFDLNGDGRFSREYDFPCNCFVGDAAGGVKAWYSPRILVEAEKRKLISGDRPPHVPTLAEAWEFWPWRDAAPSIPDAVRRCTNLAVIVYANERDHVQADPAHTHILVQEEGFRQAGTKFVRLNPDRVYLQRILPSGPRFERITAFADNPAGMTWTRSNITEGLEPSALPLGLYIQAAVCELADRTQVGNWSANLDAVLFPSAPTAPFLAPVQRRPALDSQSEHQGPPNPTPLRPLRPDTPQRLSPNR